MGKVTITALMACALAASSAQTMAATNNNANNATPAEQRLLSKGVQIVQTFPSVSGLKAIVADNGKERRLFYVTPDGKSLIAGMVFDSNGNNVTSDDMSRAGVADVGGAKALPDAELEKLWARAEKLNWIEEGAGGKKPTIYIFFDPNCPYCHRTWTMMRNAVQAGKVTVRWLPVAILKESSKGLAAALYASRSNPSLVMSQMVNHQLEPIRISDPVVKAISYNLLLLNDTGYTGVPTIMYRKNGKIRMSMGAPNDQELASMLP